MFFIIWNCLAIDEFEFDYSLIYNELRDNTYQLGCCKINTEYVRFKKYEDCIRAEGNWVSPLGYENSNLFTKNIKDKVSKINKNEKELYFVRIEQYKPSINKINLNIIDFININEEVNYLIVYEKYSNIEYKVVFPVVDIFKMSVDLAIREESVPNIELKITYIDGTKADIKTGRTNIIKFN